MLLLHFRTLIFKPEFTPLAAAQLKTGLLSWNRKLRQEGERAEPSVYRPIASTRIFQSLIAPTLRG
jgi:hypothetical protein